MPTSGSLTRLAEAVSLCSACPLGAGGRGVPGMLVLPEGQTELGWALSESQREVVMVLGEAPGGVEMARGQPFVGDSGQLLRAMLEEVGLTRYYVSNIAKHQPPRVKGKQTPPDKVAIGACAPFLRAEFDLVRPTKLILLGKTAGKLVVDGNFAMKDMVNQTFSCMKWADIPTLILYHPSYFLRQRTAPWVQKQISEWKRSLRLFLGDKAPTYRVERVSCPNH